MTHHPRSRALHSPGLGAPARMSLVLCLLVAVTSAHARRSQAPGGTVTVLLPEEQVPAFVEAHTHVTLMEHGPAGPGWSAPSVVGAGGFRSAAVARVEHPQPTKWVLHGRTGVSGLATSVERCFNDDARWPRQLLQAAGLTVTTTGNDTTATMVSSRALDVMPMMLTACPLLVDGGAPSGTFAAAGLRLSKRKSAFEPAPFLQAIQIVVDSANPDNRTADARSADVRAVHDDVTDVRTDTTTLLAPSPSVWVLVQNAAARAEDPLGLRTDDGLVRLQDEWRIDLLAAVYGAGRAAPTTSLLPTALAPARAVLEPPKSSVAKQPLALQPLPASAPKVRVGVQGGDALAAALVERLALLLRSRGVLLEAVSMPGEGPPPSIQLMRFVPVIDDAAISMLAFVGAALNNDEAILTSVRDARLLNADAAIRMAAALDLERSLQQQRALVPLLSVDSAVGVHPQLHGVRVLINGTPRLVDAWWTEEP
jgi:hypothetical protein